MLSNPPPGRIEEAGIDITDDWGIDSDGGAEVGIPGFEAKFSPGWVAGISHMC